MQLLWIRCVFVHFYCHVVSKLFIVEIFLVLFTTNWNNFNLHFDAATGKMGSNFNICLRSNLKQGNESHIRITNNNNSTIVTNYMHISNSIWHLKGREREGEKDTQRIMKTNKFYYNNETKRQWYTYLVIWSNKIRLKLCQLISTTLFLTFFRFRLFYIQFQQ